MNISKFIHQLTTADLPAHVYNPYRQPHGRHNLALYLQQMAARRPAVLLVGEALGYRGGRLTGVPFSSERLLHDNDAQVPVFGAHLGYKVAHPPAQLHAEPTATILWRVLAPMRPLPLLWNAFPFHPHQPGKPTTNRAPTTAELDWGAPFIAALQTGFGIETTAAVGRKAEQALQRMGQSAVTYIRHPSYGGKADFTAGIERLWRGINGRTAWCIPPKSIIINMRLPAEIYMLFGRVPR